MPYWFWGQKVKGQGHGAWLIVNGFRTITDSVIHLWSWNFIHLLPMSQGCALLISGSKGQRSKSWGIGDCKLFPDHNWLCNPPMIMKLHTLSPHESRMCPIDFGVKRSRSWGICDWKRFLDHNWLCNPSMIMKRHTPAPYESGMCLIDLWGSKVYWGLKIVKDVSCSFKGFLQLGVLHLRCTLYLYKITNKLFC